ncbi:hypothetical protein ACFWEK_17740, partial [Isoptericola sp. NPDC060257]
GRELPAERVGTALAAYEAAMRSAVDRAQAMYPGRVRSFAPRTRTGIAAMTGVMRLIQRGPVAAFLSRHAGDYGRAPEAAPARPVTTGR